MSLPAQAREPDWSLYARILKTYTYQGEKNGMPAVMVRYRDLKKDPDFPKVVEQLAKFPKSALKSHEEKLAFYLNGYNVLAIKMVLDHWPIEKLKALGTFYRPVWVHPAGTLAGEEVTLRYLENGVLRKMGDPRIHMALNCASMSCPDLRQEPYTAARIEEQLADQTRVFLKTNKAVRLSGDTLHVAIIFDWFREDFEPVGGVEAFLRTYRPDLPPYKQLVADMPYHWEINEHLTMREKQQWLARFSW